MTSKFTSSEFVNIYYSGMPKFQKGGKCNKALLRHSDEENLFKRLKFKAIKNHLDNPTFDVLNPCGFLYV